MNRQKRKNIEKLFKFFSFLITWVSILILVVLLYHIFINGYEYISLNFFKNFPSRRAHKAGMVAGIFGSIWLISLTAFISIPIGVATAIFLEEYKFKGSLGHILEVNIANLAGVPSIVYGLLGLSIFVRYLGFGSSILAASLTLSLLILPVIIVASRASIRAVPNSIRFGAYAIGAHKYQVLFGHVLPMAIPGILTGVILAISRAIGETAPLIIIGALSYISFIPESIMDEFTVMPIQIYNWAQRPQAEFHLVAATGIIVLMTIMLSLNFIAVYIRYKFMKKHQR